MNEVLDYIRNLIKDITNINTIYISNIKDIEQKDTAEIQIVSSETIKTFNRGTIYTNLELNVVFRVQNETNLINGLEELKNLFLKKIHLNNFSIIQITTDNVKFEELDDKLNYIYTITFYVLYNKK